MCHQFRDTGTCKYGPSCRFAHESYGFGAGSEASGAAAGVAELTAAMAEHRPFATAGSGLGPFDVSSMPPAGEESAPDAEHEAAQAAGGAGGADHHLDHEGEDEAPLE